jgi:alcohol dehydrogenase, propanol-preferring
MASAKIPETMHAWQKDYTQDDPTKPVHRQVPVPSPSPDQVLIKILAAGVCHSDVAILEQKTKPTLYANAKDNFTMGHEGCGEIIQLGTSVTDFEVGDIVAIDAVNGCLEPGCRECSGGNPQVCIKYPSHGLAGDGSYAPYIAARAKDVVRVPPGVRVEEAAVATDACMTAYHAVFDVAKVTKGETILIFGTGGLGMNGVQMALTTGARIIVSDVRQESLDVAVSLGIAKEDAIPARQSAVEFVASKQLVIDTVIDFAGTQETFGQSQLLGK